MNFALRVFKNSIFEIKYKFLLFFKTLSIPIAIIIVTYPFLLYPEKVKIIPILMFGLLNLILHICIAINVHRIIILNDIDTSLNLGLFFPKRREFNYLMHSIGLGLFYLPAFLINNFLIGGELIQTIGKLIGFLLSLYLCSRVILAFPAIAVNKDWSFIDSWLATTKNKINMIIIVGMNPLLTYLLKLLSPEDLGSSLIGFVTTLFIFIFSIVVVSVAYSEIAT